MDNFLSLVVMPAFFMKKYYLCCHMIIAHDFMGRKIFYAIAIVLMASTVWQRPVSAQSCVIESINSYGTFDRWSAREVKESGIIGGKTNRLFEFYGDFDVTRAKEPFTAPEGYLWRTNNVLAVVAGVTKTNNTVYPEKRGDGYCARLETHVESVKVLGMINMDVTCQGAVFIGSLEEPIKDTKAPMAKVLYGIPFEGRPEAVVFDYKAEVGHEVMRGTGFSPLKEMGYPDYPIVCMMLQKRWEEPDGSVHARRVGTAIHRFDENAHEWVDGYRLEVSYGDITDKPFYQDYMGLKTDPATAYYCINSKGDKVMVEEDGWADADEEPNWLILTFLASSAEAFHGGVGNILWIDNVKVEM